MHAKLGRMCSEGQTIFLCVKRLGRKERCSVDLTDLPELVVCTLSETNKTDK